MRYGEKRATRQQRGYDERWQKFRAQFLREHPLCVYCEKLGRATAANVVDHIEPHRGDQALFWKPGNHQSLCKPCHDGRKRSEEHHGYQTIVGLDGWPVDSRHPANTPRGGEKV